MRSKQVVALTIGIGLAVTFASPTFAQGTSQPGTYSKSTSKSTPTKKMHRSMRGHAAFAREPAPARICWMNGDKGAIDHGVFGYYTSCDTPGAIPAQASAWGPPRR